MDQTERTTNTWWMLWKHSSTDKITKEMAKEIQTKAGYDIRGYGFYDYKIRKEGFTYIAYWRCSKSCE